MQRRVLLLGATGLVGKELLRLLIDDESVEEIVVVGRRATRVSSPKVALSIGDLGEMDAMASRFAVDQIFCALGTTITKAKSKEAFRVVDFAYPLKAAKLGLAAGARHFLLVSALGASSTSRVFYSRVKGELEDAITALGYPSLTIARPSLLLGEREEWRTGEQIAKLFAPLTPARYKPVLASNVARALVESARSDSPGVHVIESAAIRERTG